MYFVKLRLPSPCNLQRKEGAVKVNEKMLTKKLCVYGTVLFVANFLAFKTQVYSKTGS